MPVAFPVIAPAPLPASLQPLFDLIADLARKAGYCFARTVWIAERIGVSRVHAWRLIRKLVGFGRLRIEDVPGSHERRLYPVFLPAPRKRTGNEPVSNPRRTFRETEPSTKETDSPAPSVDPAVVHLLSKEAGLPEADAVSIAADPATRKRPLSELRRIVQWFRGRGGVNSPGGYLRDAIRRGRGLGADGTIGTVTAEQERHRERERAREVRVVKAPPGFSLHKPSDGPESGAGASAQVVPPTKAGDTDDNEGESGRERLRRFFRKGGAA